MAEAEPSREPAGRVPPDGVPDDVVFDATLGAWVSGSLDEQGRRQGRWLAFRADGTTLFAGEYERGVPVGALTEYHPNGDVASVGHHRDGKLDGVFIRYASDAPGSRPLRSCCVPRGARQLHTYYDRGRVRGERFFDGEGFALRSDGSRLPERPAALPERVDFDEGSNRWVVRDSTEQGAARTTYFALDGRRVEEVIVLPAKCSTVRTFDGERLLEEKHLDAQRRLHGPYRRLHLEPPYADERIREERGEFERGHPVGPWHFSTALGEELVRVDRGSLPSRERLDELSMEAFPDGEALRARALEAARAGAVREGLWLAARRLGRGPDDTFGALLDQLSVAVGERQGGAWQALLANAKRVDPVTALTALLCGAPAAQALRVLATLAKEGSPAALDLSEAALRLDPTCHRALATRAMVRLDRGDVVGVADDARALAALGETDTAEHLEASVRALFPAWSFWPREEPEPQPEGELPELGVEQPLDAVRRTIRLYATRLWRAREWLAGHVDPGATWLPPDTSELLAGDPVELRRETVTIEDETEAGVERTEVAVDETLDPGPASVRGWMSTALADWDALVGLCWACGLDEVALPVEIRVPASFAAHVNECMVRCWQLHDVVRTGGLGARARKAAPFVWRGLDTRTLTRSLADVAARQYLERRAMFFWLLFPQNVSPFQADLRKA